MTIRSSLRRRLLEDGTKSLQTYLQSEVATLKETPVLLITSDPGATTSKIKQVADACQWVKFTLGQRFGMRTVPTTLSSAFPTQDSLEQTLEMMQRTGAASVVTVGSGAAMDLGKAVREYRNLQDSKKTPLIMVPSTFGGFLAAGASHSLFLDASDETLVPMPKRQISVEDSEDATIAALDSHKYMEPLDENKCDMLLYAVSSILLDAVSRHSQHPSLSNLLEETIRLTSVRANPSWKAEKELPAMTSALRTLLFQSAGLLSYGLNTNEFEDEWNRSIPIALGSSLIPTLFPETHPLSFLASLVPGLSKHCLEQIESRRPFHDTQVDQVFQSLLSHWNEPSGRMQPPPFLQTEDKSLEGFSIPDMALSHIQANQSVWGSLDVPDDVLVQVLQNSLER